MRKLRSFLMLLGALSAGGMVSAQNVSPGPAPASPTPAAQREIHWPFRAVHYDVSARLNPADQTISAVAKITLVSTTPSREVAVELHQDLRVASVTSAEGKKLPFQRDDSNPLTLRVTLPQAYEPGRQVEIAFEYSGPLSNEDDSPTKGLRLASVEQNGAYLLLPARWFPLTDYPANRYTATFKITAPANCVVVGTGASGTPDVAGGSATYTFRVEHPEAAGSFTASALQLTPVQAEGLAISVFAPPSAPEAAAYGQRVASIVNKFSGDFGALASPNLTLAQMPDGSVPGFSAPGVLLVSARQWSTKINDRLLAQLIAGQWWGSAVLPASPSDVWISDGLARYCEALYEEDAAGTAGMRKALEDFAVGALMYDEAAPIAQAQRLQPYSEQYRSVVMNKGAMVFHMLRAQIGGQAFTEVLRRFYAEYAGKSASIAEFERLAQAQGPAAGGNGRAATASLVPFFSQWLDSTGVPEFKMDYVVYRTQKGFKTVGKIHQDLETFRMPVQLRVETEGNPETKTVMVVGKNTEFVVDTYGRPKPHGITIDPDNNLLKSSTKLRVLASVARGEGQAALGKYYEAVQDYQQALDMQPNNSLAHFRMGEAMFYQKNYQAAANAFRSSLDGDLDPSYKWVEVWSHIYLGKIFDVTGQRERALNEYKKAQELKDDTGGAQAEATRYLYKPYSETKTVGTAQ